VTINVIFVVVIFVGIIGFEEEFCKEFAT